MNDPWAFGWTPLLTIVGLVLTAVIASMGFRTFGRWKREQLEQHKIDISLKALQIAYHSKWVFENIRSPLVYEYEWADMPPAGTEEKRRAKGEYYGKLKRIEAHKKFFESVWEIQPGCMAVFGPEVEKIFLQLHRARREIEVAAQMLIRHVDDAQLRGGDPNQELWAQLRADLTGEEGALAREGDRVGRKLLEFRDGIETLCRPIISRRSPDRRGLLSWIKHQVDKHRTP